MPTVEDFRSYIQRTKLKAADQGADVLELDAEGIHLCVAGASHGFSDMSQCREAMEAEVRPGDKVLRARNGKKANLTVAYRV
jgi:hypothetical protein